MKVIKLLLLSLLFAPFVNGQIFTEDVQKQIDEQKKIIKSPLSNKVEKGDAYNSLGFVYKNEKEYDLAIDCFEKSYDLFLKDKHDWGQGISLMYLGYVYTDKKHYKTALDYMFQSYNQFKNTGYKEDMSFVMLSIGYLYFLRGNNVKSIDYYQRCLDVSLKENYKENIYLSYSFMGTTYQNMGDLPKALENFQKSLDFAEKRKNSLWITSAIINITWVYFELGNYTKCIELANRSLKIAKNDENYMGIADSYNLIGASYKEIEKYDQALIHLNKSLENFREINHVSGIGICYNNIATVYFEMKDLEKSLEYHLKGLKYAQDLKDEYSIPLSTNNVGTVYYKMGDFEKGKSYAIKSEKLAEKYGNPRIIKMTKNLLFEINFSEGNYELAENYLMQIKTMNDKSIEINFPVLSESEKEKFFKNISKEYMAMYYFALSYQNIKPEFIDEIYNITLKNKGLLLRSSTAMKNSILSGNNKDLINKYEKWIEIKNEIAKSYSNGDIETKKLEDQANLLEKELVKESEYFADIEKVQKITWKDVQNDLKDDEVAVEFIHFNKFNKLMFKSDTVIYAALVIDKKSEHPKFIQLCYEHDLEEILGKYGGNNLNYINKIYGTKKEPNQALYNLIWKPLEGVLNNKKTVSISPSGILHRVSFSALSDNSNHYLSERFHINVLSSTGKIVMHDEFVFKGSQFITLFGGIDYDSDDSKRKIWSFLNGTKEEVESIEKILAKNKHTIQQANDEIGFKTYAPKSDIIHLSTHGFFYPDPEDAIASFEIDIVESTEDIAFRGTNALGVNSFVINKNPLMRSGLVLSGANKVWNQTYDEYNQNNDSEDGVLTAFEVAQSDLRNTGLVVLSACETGLGDIHGSEGVYGLQRAFKMAGVKFIIMSLWQVPDKETQEFMVYFYEKLMEVKNVKMAFGLTQTYMRKKYDPYYWAAFVLIE